MSKERVQKILSECGVASRREAEGLILQGRVKVNGHTVKLGDKAERTDVITVSGQRVSMPENKRYIMVYKPRGYVTTMNDEKDRKCVADLVTDIKERVYPVGRLDRDSEGLLLMTNDGDFANSIMHPAMHIPKIYRVTIRPGITEEQMEKFRNGMMLEGEKTKTAPAEISILSRDKLAEDGNGIPEERIVVEVVLYEGRNRQIRRMFEQLHIEVARLRRVAIGNVKLGMLAPAKWRELKDKEVQSLLKASGSAEIKKQSDGKKEAGSRDIHRSRR